MSVDFPTPEGVTVWLVEKTGQSGPYLSLDKIHVADERRRQGLGSATMLELCRLADQRGVIVALTPGDDWGTSKAFLPALVPHVRLHPQQGTPSRPFRQRNHDPLSPPDNRRLIPPNSELARHPL
jgi:GNAT superfamily N-acetyltransferase